MHPHPGPAPSSSPDRVWAAVSGVAFVAYPALRPWGAETGTGGAATFADPAWLVAHLLGMVGFVALALATRRTALATTGWLGVALVLPYYGAEAFGLHALGRWASSDGDASALAVADLFRYDPVALATFAAGLVVLGVLGIRLAWRLRTAPAAVRAACVLVAVGLATYLPQFFLPPAGRVAHGVVLGAGLLLVAAAGRAASSAPSPAAA